MTVEELKCELEKSKKDVVSIKSNIDYDFTMIAMEESSVWKSWLEDKYRSHIDSDVKEYNRTISRCRFIEKLIFTKERARKWSSKRFKRG